MPPRKKIKNQNFEIHRDESCLSSNASQQELSSSAAAIPAPAAVLTDVLEHDEVAYQSRHGFSDPTQSIYSDPGEPGYSQLVLEEITEVTEPDPSGLPGQPDVQTCSAYEPHSLAYDNRYDQQSANYSQYTEGQTGDSQFDDSQIDQGTRYINQTQDDQMPDANAARDLRMVGEVESECSLMNHSIDQSYNAEADSQYDVTTGTDAATPRRHDDSSSPQEPDDSIFSNRSPRSSIGSLDSGMARKNPGGTEANSSLHSQEFLHGSRSSRPSEMSESEGDFTSSSRRTPRPAHYRVGSDIHRKTHLSSPSGSVHSSSKRGAITRIGSPSFPVQYLPKGRTPTRFRVPAEAPLVLLHATMLPLQWNWANVLEEAAAAAMEGKCVLSDAIKNLRDAWTLLVDRTGDTVLERGVLLSHPQNDFEVLEERVLEALELPLRRRARILECGHYLGPANYMSLSEDEETDYDDSSFMSYEVQRRKATSTRHWCTTCQNEIRCDALGSGKIFRVKVYASNGLMRAGAWEACWQEMERVDIEIEPVVDSQTYVELTELAADQQKQAEEANAKKVAADKEKAAAQGIILKIDDQTRRMNEERERREQELYMEREMELLRSQKALPIEAPPAVGSRISAAGQTMLGMTPDVSFRRQSTASAAVSNANCSVLSVQQQAQQKSAQAPGAPARPIPDTLPGLLFEACRVALRDLKNLAILVLGILAMGLAFRGGHQQQSLMQLQNEQHPRAQGGISDQVPQAQMQHQDAPEVQQYQENMVDAAKAEAYRAYLQEQVVMSEPEEVVEETVPAPEPEPEIVVEEKEEEDPVDTAERMQREYESIAQADRENEGHEDL